MKTANKKRIVERLTAASIALGVSLAANSAERLVNPERTQPIGSLVPFVLSSTNLADDDVKGYRPWLENGSWQGDIGEYNVSDTGALTTSLDYSGPSPVNTDEDGNWSTILTYAAKEAADSDYWEERKIITAVAGSQVAFTWSAIGSNYQEAIDPEAAANNEDSSLILNHIRGDRSNEFPSGGDNDLRDRISVLGATIHNTPLFVGPPDGFTTTDGYPAWATDLADRESRLYVGSDDGMLHVFDVEDGSEVYAYIPSMLKDNLANIANLPFQHTYFVDGHLTATDAYFNNTGTTSGSPAWHTVLVGTLGAGGKGIFALNITDPDLDDISSDTKVMWERSANGDDDLGYTYAKGVIARLNDGNWYVIIGNGYSSENGEAVLYILNIATGAVKRKISTETGTSESPNGLSSPVLVDIERDGRADIAYAGDIDGDLWKFDLTASDPDDWEVAYNGAPLYNGATTQPITLAPRVSLHPNNGYLVHFATGKLLTTDDLTDTSTQGLFAVQDDFATPPNNPTFLTQPWEEVILASTEDENIRIYNPDEGEDLDWTDSDVIGWRVLFAPGERILRPLQVRGNRIKGIATNPTTEFGDNWMVEAALWDGGPHPSPIFDFDRDGALYDDDDDIYNAGGADSEDHVPMMWRQADGVLSEVTIARISEGVDTLFLNHLVLPYDDEPECFENCEGGLKGGHIDLDTWHRDVAYGGGTSQHDHEYDKQIGDVNIDFFDINLSANGEPRPRRDVTNQINVDDDPSEDSGWRSNIAEDEKFIVLVANADFSRSATLSLGDREWNAFEYQRAVHTALKNWDASDPDSEPMYDPDGDGGEAPISLAYTWREIKNALPDEDGDGEGDGLFKYGFGDRAILDGGLHPTQPYCLTRNAYGADGGDPTTLEVIDGRYVGRWRNGSLVTQLVAFSHFAGAEEAIERVRIQYPLDLQETVQVKGVGQLSSTIDFNGNDIIEEENHERIGGVLAASGTELLWESALFWHFGSLYEAIYGVKPCYGDDEWADATTIEQANDPLAEALDRIDDDLEDFDFTGDNIDEALDKVRECLAEEGVEPPTRRQRNLTRCQQLYRLLEKVGQIIEHYEIENYGPDDPGDPGQTGEAEASVVEGSVTQRTDTEQTAFRYGRKSWMDIQ